MSGRRTKWARMVNRGSSQVPSTLLWTAVLVLVLNCTRQTQPCKSGTWVYIVCLKNACGSPAIGPASNCYACVLLPTLTSGGIDDKRLCSPLKLSLLRNCKRNELFTKQSLKNLYNTFHAPLFRVPELSRHLPLPHTHTHTHIHTHSHTHTHTHTRTHTHKHATHFHARPENNVTVFFIFGSGPFINSVTRY